MNCERRAGGVGDNKNSTRVLVLHIQFKNKYFYSNFLNMNVYITRNIVTYKVKKSTKIDQNRPRVTQYKLHQCEPKFASDHNLGSADCSAAQKQNR